MAERELIPKDEFNGCPIDRSYVCGIDSTVGETRLVVTSLPMLHSWKGHVMTMRLTAILTMALLASSLFTAAAEARGGGFGGGGHMGMIGGAGLGVGSHIGGLGARTNIGAANIGRLGNMPAGTLGGETHSAGIGGANRVESTDGGLHLGEVGAHAGTAGTIHADHHVGVFAGQRHRAINSLGIDDDDSTDCFDWQQLHPTEPLPLTCG
jgi:hypothetical protein